MATQAPDKSESALKTYLKQQRQKARTESVRTAASSLEELVELAAAGSGPAGGAKPRVSKKVRMQQEGTGPAADTQVVSAEMPWTKEQVKASIAASESNNDTQQTGFKQLRQTILDTNRELQQTIRTTNLRTLLEQSKQNARLIKSIQGMGGSGGGGGIFDGIGGGNGNGGGAKKQPGKWGQRLRTGAKVLGGAALGGGLGYLGGKALGGALGVDEDTAQWLEMGGAAAGTLAGGVLGSEAGRKGAGRLAKGAGRGIMGAGRAIASRPVLAGSVLDGGYAAYSAANNIGTITDSNADTADRLKAGSHLAVSGAGATIGGLLGGPQGAAYGAALGDGVANLASGIGGYLNDAISGSAFGDIVQNAVGTGFDAMLSPFSEEARKRLGTTFSGVGDLVSSASTTISSLASSAKDKVGSVLSEAGGIAATVTSTVGAAGMAAGKQVGEAVATVPTAIASASMNMGKTLTTSLVPALGSAADKITDGITSFGSWIKDFGAGFSELKNQLGKQVDNFIDGAKNVTNAVIDGGKVAATTIFNAARGGYQQASTPSGGGSTPAAGGGKGGAPAIADGTKANLQGPGPIGSRDAPVAGGSMPSAAAPATPSMMDKVKGVAGAVTAGVAAVPTAAKAGLATANPGVYKGTSQMGDAVSNSLSALGKGFRSKQNFDGIKGGSALNQYGTYTDDEAAKIKELKTSGANTTANLKGGMPDSVRDKIIASAMATGRDPKSMLAMAAVESGGNTNAVSNTGASGIYQFVGRTATGVGIKDRFNEDQNIAGGMKLAAENEASLKKRGIDATPENLYMAHQLGPAVASELISAAKSGKAVSELSPDAQSAMAKNYGGGKGGTAADYIAANKKALDDRYKSVVKGGDEAIAAAKSGKIGVATAEATQMGPEKLAAKAEPAKDKPAGSLSGPTAPATTVTGMVAPTPAAPKSSTSAPLTAKSDKSGNVTDKNGKVWDKNGELVSGADSKITAAKAAPTAVSPERQKTAQELMPGMFKQTPMSPMASESAKPPSALEGARSFNASPLARGRNDPASAVGELAKARPTEYERIKDTGPQVNQVEITNLPEPVEPTPPQGGGAGYTTAGKSKPFLEEIPTFIDAPGLMLLQMGHA